MIRILLFEDNKNYREALEESFQDSTEIFLVKALENANKVVRQIKEYKPDVVLMDIEMPDISGLDALNLIKKANIDIKVMIQTQYEDDHRIFVSLCRGALGYSLKSDSFEELERAIINVNNGGGYFSPSIAAKVACFFLDKDVQADPEYISLTSREQEVLSYLVKGLKYKEIAEAMYVSYEAVHSHIKNIYPKLHVTSKSAAILKAIQSKLI